MVQRTVSLTIRAASLMSLVMFVSACEQYESARDYTMDTLGMNDKPAPSVAPKSVDSSVSQQLPAPTAPVTSATAPAALSADELKTPAPEVTAPTVAPAAVSKTEEVAVDSRKPVLVVRFNQSHVYFDQAVANVVKAVESSKPGLQYDVVSYLPDLSKLSPEQQANVNTRAGDNMKDVVAQVQQNGVAASRIHVGTATEPVTSQEIKIFVR